MAIRYRFGDSERPHFITFSVIEWIDVFNRECYKEILVDSIKYSIINKGLIVHAWVIMPNHVHMIVSATQGNDLSNIIRDINKFTSRKIVRAIEDNTIPRKAENIGCYGCSSVPLPKTVIITRISSGNRTIILSNL